MNDFPSIRACAPGAAEPLGLTPGIQGALGSSHLEAASNVSLTPESQFVRGLEGVDTARTELVQAIRDEIAQGVYATPDKLDAACDGLLDHLREAAAIDAWLRGEGPLAL